MHSTIIPPISDYCYIWLSFSFFPGVKKDYEILLVMFYVWQRKPRINPQGFPASKWERSHFSCFSTFQTLSYRISKNIQANPCYLQRTTKQMHQGSLKYKEPDSRGNNLKIARSFSLLQNVAF